MDCSTPGSPVLHYLSEFAQIHVHWVGDAIQPSSPALNLSQHQGLFQWIGSSHQVMVDVISDLFSSLHICSPVCGHTSLTGLIWRLTPLISRSPEQFLQSPPSFLFAPLVFLSWCSVFYLKHFLSCSLAWNSSWLCLPSLWFFFLTILRFFSLQFLRTCPSSLICFSVASCSYLKAACLFLTLRQYLRLWYSCSLACWFVFQLGRPASLSCVRHFSNCDHLSPSSFLRMRHLQSLPACSEPASWWGSGAVVRRDLANAKESTSPPGVSQQRLASRCVLVGICHILSLKTPGSQLTHFWASKLWGPLWSYVIFVLTLCLYAFIAFIRLLIMLVSRERIDYQEEMINSIFQSAIFP